MRKIKTYKLFESVDTDELLSIVKDMLRELDFNDFSHNVVSSGSSDRYNTRVEMWFLRI